MQIPEELLNETIVTLERVGCQSRYYCGRAPFDSSVLTTRCYVCETLAKLHELKRPAPIRDTTPDDRFDEKGTLIRCVCGGELEPVEDAVWGTTKRCPKCAREYS